MSEHIYPKALSPVTPAVWRMANDRADRWMQRCQEARAEVVRLNAVIEEMRAR